MSLFFPNLFSTAFPQKRCFLLFFNKGGVVPPEGPRPQKKTTTQPNKQVMVGLGYQGVELVVYFVYSRSPPNSLLFLLFSLVQSVAQVTIYLWLLNSSLLLLLLSFGDSLPAMDSSQEREREREGEVVKEVGVMFLCVCVCVCCWQGMFLFFSHKQRIFSVACFWAIS